jgi:hypothetical protein
MENYTSTMDGVPLIIAIVAVHQFIAAVERERERELTPNKRNFFFMYDSPTSTNLKSTPILKNHACILHEKAGLPRKIALLEQPRKNKDELVPTPKQDF